MPTASANSGGSDFELIPASIHHAICYSVIDCGTQKSTNPAFNDAHKIILNFELPFQRGTFKKDGVDTDLPRATSKEYTLSIGSKAYLRRDLESWRGKPFTKEEEAAFETGVLAGINCQVNIAHKTGNNGKTYANIIAIVPLGQGMEKKTAENPIVVWDMPTDGSPIVIPQNVPEWIQKKIEGSLEYQAQLHPESVPDHQKRDDANDQAFPTNDGVDEDVPF